MPRSISQFNDPIFQPPASAFYPPDFRERRISRCQPRNRNELLIARILIDFLESVKDILSSNSHRLNSNDCNSVRGSFGNRGAGNRSKKSRRGYAWVYVSISSWERRKNSREGPQAFGA